MSTHTPGPLITRRFHIISITMRRAVGDRAYRLCESFDANLEEACRRRVQFSHPGVRVAFLRDGATGHRYSHDECSEIVREAAFEAEHLAKLRTIKSSTGSAA